MEQVFIELLLQAAELVWQYFIWPDTGSDLTLLNRANLPFIQLADWDV